MGKVIINVFIVALFAAQGYSQTNWSKYPGNPVMEPDQDWETRVIAPNAVLYDNEQYHMWYTAGEFPALGGELSIGHAVSDDGLSWTKDEVNPVFTRGDGVAWDDKSVYKAAVLKIDSTYHMWYTGYSNEGGIIGIGHATSDDGLEWNRDDSQPVLTVGTSGEWDDSRVAHPTVVHDGSIFHMWYAGYKGDGSTIELGHATSADGSVWTKDPQNPVISYDVEGWDNPQLDYPFAIYDGAEFHIWYNGGGFLGWDIGYAKSVDGTNWDKHPDPLLTRGDTGAWDSRYLSMPVVLHDAIAQKYRMWYRGESIENTKGGIGYAEWLSLPKIVTAIEEFREINIPVGISLSQNYPNPFNPTTTINYQLSMNSDVVLAVYNILGQRVATLVDKKQQAGNYSVQWDAISFASGVYFYILETSTGLKMSKKLVLLK